MKPQLADQQLIVSTALPASNTTATSKGIDLGSNPTGEFVAECELLISVPAVVTGALADAATHKFDIVTGASVDSSNVIQSVTTIAATVLTQTGAGGAGSGAVSVRVRLPVGVARFVGVKVTKSDNHDASAVSFTAQLVF